MLVEKLREKQAQKPARNITATPPRENVVNLIDMLKRSLAAAGPSASSRRRAATAAKRTAGERSPARTRRVG